MKAEKSLPKPSFFSLAAALAMSIAAFPSASGAAAHERPYVIKFEGEITAILEQYMVRKLQRAKDGGADLVIVEIESPGGSVNESFDIAEMLRDVDWARTVAYIPKNAYSGAAVVALGCDDILMGPEALLGDVGMIMVNEERTMLMYAPEKVLSAWKPRIRTLAEAKGRSPALAEAMMDKAVEVYQYENRHTAEKKYMTAADAKAAGGDWKRGAFVPESRKDVFLTVNGRRAVELGLAEGLALNRAEALARYDAPEPVVLEWTAVDTTVQILNAPLVTGLLLIAGLVCLYIEFSAPGIGIGGLLSGLCFAIFFWSHFLGGTAAWLEVTLFLAGLVFIGIEMFLFPGFGIAGLTGLLLVVSSVVLASQEFVLPRSESEIDTFGTNLMVIAGTGAGFIAAAILVRRHFGSIPLLRSLRLEPPAAPRQAPAPFAAVPVAVGALGEAHTALRPGGKARFDQHLVDVVADNTFIDRGQTVEVVEIAGTRVVVREA